MNDRITAGELRELGFPVPESIPDVATTARSGIKMSVGEVHHSGGDTTVVIDVKCTFIAGFKWINLEVVLEPEEA